MTEATTDSGTTNTAPASESNSANVAPAQPDGGSLLNSAPAPQGNTEAPKAEAGKVEETIVEGAPESYADFNVAEGVTLDADLTTEFKSIAKEMNLTQAKSQTFVDLAVKLSQKIQQSQIDAHSKAINEWVEQSKTDKDFGGEKFEQNLTTAKSALDKFATPELKTLLAQTGLGNHPEMIRAFVKIGQAISDDSFVSSRNSAPGGKEESFYDKAARTLYSKQ